MPGLESGPHSEPLAMWIESVVRGASSEAERLAAWGPRMR